MTGEAFTIWIVRAAAILYAAGLALWLVNTCASGHKRARLAWTLGCLCFVAHVFGAFQYFHHWSHAAAYIETARQTRELTGWESGSGLYFNYAFLAVWVIDALWWWVDFEGYERRPRWISASVHGFLAFLCFNATV